MVRHLHLPTAPLTLFSVCRHRIHFRQTSHRASRPPSTSPLASWVDTNVDLITPSCAAAPAEFRGVLGCFALAYTSPTTHERPLHGLVPGRPLGGVCWRVTRPTLPTSRQRALGRPPQPQTSRYRHLLPRPCRNTPPKLIIVARDLAGRTDSGFFWFLKGL